MIQKNHESNYHSNPLNVFVVALIGGLAGSVLMLLFAPQSGKDTRKQIREKVIEMRDRTSKMVEDTIVQVRSNGTNLLLSEEHQHLGDRAKNISNQVSAKPKTEMQKMSEDLLYNDSLGG